MTLLVVSIFAISLSLMNFKDFSWDTNKTSYLGFIIFFVLLIFRAVQSQQDRT